MYKLLPFALFATAALINLAAAIDAPSSERGTPAGEPQELNFGTVQKHYRDYERETNNTEKSKMRSKIISELETLRNQKLLDMNNKEEARLMALGMGAGSLAGRISTYERKGSPPTLGELPKDVFDTILKMVLDGADVTQIKSLLLTNKSFNEAMLHTVTELDLAHLPITDDALSNIVATFPYLRSLNLMACDKITNDGLAHLANLKHLTNLDLSRTTITDAGLVHLVNLTNLKKLNLWRTGITDAGLAHLVNLTNLTNLELGQSRITDVGLAHLSNLKHLTKLNLSRTTITDVGLVHLANLTNLTWLYLSNTLITDAGLVHLEKLTNLTVLSLAATRITDAGLVHLEKLTNLTKLNLGGNAITDAGLVHLEKLTNLTELELNQTTVSDEGLAHLEKLSKLTRVHLQDTIVTNAGWTLLKNRGIDVWR